MDIANLMQSAQRELNNVIPLDLLKQEEYAYALIIALVIIFITTILLFFLRRRKTLRNAVLMLGLSDSGKTLLFSKLFASKIITTYTSMKCNAGMIMTQNQKAVKLLDIPGNERLCSKFLDENINSCKGILFVVDSLSFQKEIRDVASYLYSVLSEPFVQKNSIPFLMVCNKQDQALAKSPKVIQSQLEKEMNALRQTETGKLRTTSSEDDNVFLGIKGKEFQFVDLKPIKVEFIECSALESGRDGDSRAQFPDIWSWISKIA